jgi:hypothetical protein
MRRTYLVEIEDYGDDGYRTEEAIKDALDNWLPEWRAKVTPVEPTVEESKNGNGA